MGVTKDAKGGLEMSKYGNRKTELDGILFDSRHEATRWIELRYMERAGLITDLRRQVPFELIPAVRENGKVKQRAITYIADFVYMAKDGETGNRQIVEDAKSPATLTQVFKIKKKLMYWKYGIEVKEV